MYLFLVVLEKWEKEKWNVFLMFEWAPSCALIMLIAVFKNLVTRYIFYCFFTSLEIFFLQLHLVLVALRLVEKYWCSICLSKKMILGFWQSFRKDFLKVKIQFSILVRVHYVLTYFSDNLLENNVKKFVRSFFVFFYTMMSGFIVQQIEICFDFCY